MRSASGFDFIDLFAGVGGFHAALQSVGGRAVQAAEIDPNAARVYAENWGLVPDSDVRWLASDPTERVEDHSLLSGGFPCQPFSKSGRQLGISEDRGTLFYDIISILRAKRPPVVMLENVRNLAGPRQSAAWNAVLSGLREVGYAVSPEPCVFSPHLLSPDLGGSPQVRERLYIMAVYVGTTRSRLMKLQAPVENKPHGGWDPQAWSLANHALLPEPTGHARQRYALTGDQETWINTWNELVARLGSDTRMPGFPLWEPVWTTRRLDLDGVPRWKQVLLGKNRDFYLSHRPVIDSWRRANPQLKHFPISRRKFEWQAQDAERDLWKLLLQLRPSGIRVKQPTYAPALVAMNQASIYGPKRRFLTPLEAARLQGFDDSFGFGAQLDALSYKQMGNAIAVGAAVHVLSEFVDQNQNAIVGDDGRGLTLVESVLSARDRRHAPSFAEQTA